jgi:hypothetical protein
MFSRLAFCRISCSWSRRCRWSCCRGCLQQRAVLGRGQSTSLVVVTYQVVTSARSIPLSRTSCSQFKLVCIVRSDASDCNVLSGLIRQLSNALMQASTLQQSHPGSAHCAVAAIVFHVPRASARCVASSKKLSQPLQSTASSILTAMDTGCAVLRYRIGRVENCGIHAALV